jgi:UDP:flavonoid glycosyltransferase YjiC (YdhE family)
MARILIATVPVIGHIAPFFPLVRNLIARGHDVRWYTGEKYRARIEATGARHYPYVEARDVDDARFDEQFRERGRLQGVAQLKFDMKHIFIDTAPGQLADLRQIHETFPADVVVGDPGMIGANFHEQLGGPRAGVLGVLPMMLTSVDAAPFGLGLPPSPSALGRARNRALNGLVQHVLFRDVQAHWNATRAKVGLPATGWWMDQAATAAFYLQPSVPGFEYPRRELPGNVRFIGMMPPERPSKHELPPFWKELSSGRPVVHVTQGTIATAEPDLIRPALEGLAGEDVLVVVSTGNRPIESLKLGTLPGNARIATFLSYPDLLPKTSVMVTNGGYGGTQMALSYGVPLVVGGISEDKPEVAARVAWSGTGINLKTAKPTPEAVRTAVRSILTDGRYRERAGALAKEYASYDAVSIATQEIEKVIENPADRRAQATAA